MKKLLISFIVVLVSSMVSCGDTNYKVQVYIYDMKDPFMEDYANYILESADESFDISLYDSQNSQIIQNEMIEEGFGALPDLIIVNPVDRLGSYTIIEKAKKLNIPIIFINREPLTIDLDKYDKAYYVGAKAKQSAILQAEIIDELFGGSYSALNHLDLNGDNTIQAIIFKGEQGHQDAESRTEFVQSKLLEMGYKLDILTIQTADWNQANAYQLAISVLEIYREQVEIIISNNDAMALGVIEALVELNIIVDEDEDGRIDPDSEPWLPVIGIDGISEALEGIEKGYFHATVINDSKAQGEATSLLAYSILLDQIFESDKYNLEDNKYIWIDYQKNVREK